MNFRKKADGLFVFGSDIKLLPLAAARLARRLRIARIIFSGGVGRLTPVEWRQTSEGEVYAEVARRLGLPAHAEGTSKTTWQNARFSINQLEANNIPVEDLIVMADAAPPASGDRGCATAAHREIWRAARSRHSRLRLGAFHPFF